MRGLLLAVMFAVSLDCLEMRSKGETDATPEQFAAITSPPSPADEPATATMLLDKQ